MYFPWLAKKKNERQRGFFFKHNSTTKTEDLNLVSKRVIILRQITCHYCQTNQQSIADGFPLAHTNKTRCKQLGLSL